MPLSSQDRARLIALARSAVEAQVRGAEPPEPLELSGILGERRGCFVTLTNHDRLRGCIGTFQPAGPLGETLLHMGQAAAQDPRFYDNPITAAQRNRYFLSDDPYGTLSPIPWLDRTFNVPDRMPRSWPPPSICAAICTLGFRRRT